MRIGKNSFLVNPASITHVNRVGRGPEQRGGEATDSSATDTVSQKDGFPETLPWLNASQKRLASQRFVQSTRLKVPYTYACQRIGDTTWFLDGGLAFKHSEIDATDTKFFSRDGLAWNEERARTIYFCLPSGHQEAIELGTVNDLLGKKLNLAEVGQFLEVSALHDDEPDKSYRQTLEEQAKVGYYLLFASGEIFQRDVQVANFAVSDLEKKRLTEVVDDVMALSAGGNNPVLLDAALKLGYHPSRLSQYLSKTPLEQAEHCGAASTALRIRKHLAGVK